MEKVFPHQYSVPVWCAGEPGAGAADRPAHTGDPGATEAAAGDAHSQDQAGGQSFFPFAIF